MDCRRFPRPALTAALLSAAFALAVPSVSIADGFDGRNDARGPLLPSAEAAAGAVYSQGRNAAPRRSTVVPGNVLARACDDPSGRNSARTGIALSCADLDADGAPEI